MIDTFMQQWLTATYYHETVDFWTEETRPITNQELMDRPQDERPIEWINPFELSEQQIDEMRISFKGGALKWSQYVEQHIPFLNPKEERKKKIEANKQRDLLLCGKPKHAFDANGELVVVGTYQCNRYQLCPRCKARRQQQLLSRLQKLDGCRMVEMDSKERAEAIKKYGKDKVYCIPADNGKISVIIETDEQIGIELDYEKSKWIAEHNQVSGSKISGDLGKATKAKDEYQVTLERKEFVIEASRKEIEKMVEEVKEETADLLPTTPEELQEAIKKCEWKLIEVAKRHCAKIHFDRKHYFSISIFDIDWTRRVKKVLKT